MKQEDNILRDNKKFILTFTPEHLNIKIARQLKEDKISTYEVAYRDIAKIYRDISDYWLSKNYSIIFKNEHRTIILKYN